jgi:hypothetical protein
MSLAQENRIKRLRERFGENFDPKKVGKMKKSKGVVNKPSL